MAKREFDQAWTEAAKAVLGEIKQWRLLHPKATMEQIEDEVDQRLAPLRAQIVQDVASASAAAEWKDLPASERPKCLNCGVPLHSRGKAARRLKTNGDQGMGLTRCYGVCPRCERGFFPSG